MKAMPLLTALPAPPGLLAALNGPPAASHQLLVASTLSVVVLVAPKPMLPKMQLLCAAPAGAADPPGGAASYAGCAGPRGARSQAYRPDSLTAMKWRTARV
jgi:hypothetical protein